jgi:hypothetical protein
MFVLRSSENINRNHFIRSKPIMTRMQWEKSYEDWLALLHRADAKELLADPEACFDEGWRQAAMIATSIVQHNPEATPLELAVLLERKLLR